MSEKFKARYQVEDGYAGGSRPRHFMIDANDLNEDMTDEEIESFYEEMVDEDFNQNITPYCEHKSEFIGWAKEQLRKRDNE